MNINPYMRIYYWIEFTILFGLLPVLFYVFRDRFGAYIIPFLLVSAVSLLYMMWNDRLFNRRRLWNTLAIRPGVRMIIYRFIPIATTITIAVWIFMPDQLFDLPLEQTETWLLIIIAYPLVSVYPQEIIFRTFIFHRYRHILSTNSGLILVSASAFGLGHLLFANWIAPVFTMIGGVLFAHTYQRTKSTIVASIEHSLWGMFIFTVGLGNYFTGELLTLAR